MSKIRRKTRRLQILKKRNQKSKLRKLKKAYLTASSKQQKDQIAAKLSKSHPHLSEDHLSKTR